MNEKLLHLIQGISRAGRRGIRLGRGWFASSYSKNQLEVVQRLNH
ncbi:hypothetical protein LCGC14_1997680, partial [marine sediment metagenome]